VGPYHRHARREEALESGNNKDYRRSESFSNRSLSSISKHDKPVEGVSHEDSRIGSADDKLHALR
jgi:hypothetical protein